MNRSKSGIRPPASTYGACTSALHLFGLVILLALLPAFAGASDWQQGDVFVGDGQGRYRVFSKDGIYKETLSTPVGGEATGCAFTPDFFRLYTTNHTNTKVHIFNASDPHALIGTLDTNADSPGGGSESIVFDDSDGTFYVGHPDGDRDILRYLPTDPSTLNQRFDAAVEERGTDWLDLTADGNTLYYTSEGRQILRYDVLNNLQLTPLPTPLAPDDGGKAYALRLLPPGDGFGGMLVADRFEIKRLGSDGVVVGTYDAPLENDWFALTLDENGTSFWAGGVFTGKLYRFNIATGAIEVGPIHTGDIIRGLCVKEGPGPTAPCAADDLLAVYHVENGPFFGIDSINGIDQAVLVSGSPLAAGLNGVTAMAYDAASNLVYLATGDGDDSLYKTILSTGVTTKVGTGFGNGASNVQAMDLAPAAAAAHGFTPGKLYAFSIDGIGGCSGNCLFEVDPVSGVATPLRGFALNQARGMSFHPTTGELWVYDSGGKNLYTVTPGGSLSFQFTVPGSNTAACTGIDTAESLAHSCDGRLFTVDVANGVLLEIDVNLHQASCVGSLFTINTTGGSRDLRALDGNFQIP